MEYYYSHHNRSIRLHVNVATVTSEEKSWLFQLKLQSQSALTNSLIAVLA